MFGLVRDEVSRVVGGMGSIPQEKQGAVVDTAAGSLMNGLKKFATPAALGALLGGGSAAGGVGGSGAVGSLSSGMISDLVAKAGLSSSAAKGVAAGVVPAVVSLLGKHAGSTPGFDISSMIGALGGGGAKASGGLGNLGGIAGALGGLFGKK